MDDTTKKLSALNILTEYPELRNFGIGPYGITYLQILCAVTKHGETHVRNSLKGGVDYVNAVDNLGKGALHYAAFNGNLELVRLLLENGADVNSNKKYHMDSDYDIDQKWARLKHYIMDVSGLKKSFSMTGTPVHFSISGGSLPCTLFLIQSGANLFLRNAENLNPIELILHHEEDAFLDFFNLLLNGIEPPILDFKRTVVNLLLRYSIKLNKPAYMRRLLVEKGDGLGEMQFLAASMGHVECLKLLIEDGVNFSYSRNDDTLLERIFMNITNPEEFILGQLDGGVRIDQRDHVARRISFDFSILAPENGAQMNILNGIGNLSSPEKLIEFLNHPLIEVFLKLKWEKVKKFFYLQILTYSIFVLTLSTYVLQLMNGNNFPAEFSGCIKYLLILSALTALIHAFLQIALSFRKSNSKYEILMSFSCAALALVIIFNDSGRSSQVPNWILHATSIVILLSWMQLMLLIGRLPTYGYYALMFTAVLQNVVKVLITFVCLLIGFALSFSIQFHGSEHFKNPFLSIFKTTVMMMGEFEYADLFTDDPAFRLPTTSRIVFLLFVILVSIVLMNLMIGLAVNDIQGLQEEGHTKRCLKQADFLKNFEEVLQVLQRINECLCNAFSCFVDYLQSCAKLDLSLVLDLNSKNYRNIGLKKKYIEQLFQKISKRQNEDRDIEVEIAEKVVALLKKEFQYRKISRSN